MNYEVIKKYCLRKPGTHIACPFGPFPICFKVGTRIFLERYPDDDKITVRCEPMLADFYRQSHPGIVIPGYHCPDRQKRFKNTIYLNQGLEDELLYQMLDHSYEEALKSLSKKEREGIAGL
ncbi:MAG TPA: MmcQ/YjbR family DNA-binding protein [Mobilitalea sp.]|nr:MmcQ/YjbR family DNA-binding protein [Mobilitalea sp.]